MGVVMNTFETIRQMLADRMNIDANTITPDTTLESLNIDSLGLFDLVFDAEDKFGVQIDNNNLPNIATVQDIANLIDSIKDKK